MDDAMQDESQRELHAAAPLAAVAETFLRRSSNMRKVLVGIPCLLRGGTEMQTLTLVRGLIQRGWRVGVCCYHEYDSDVASEFREAGARLLLLGLPRRLEGRNWTAMPGLVKTLRRVFQRERPHVLHVQYMAPGLAPVLAARLAGLRNLIATVHQPGWPHGRRARCMLRLAARLCRRFVCVSQAAERSWFGSSALYDPADPASLCRRHGTIYNAVDVERIRAAVARADLKQLRRELGLDSGPVVGTVARLAPEKGVDVLVQAFSQVRQRVPAAQLLIVGDGRERLRLQHLAQSTGVAPAVRWAGRRPWEEAMACMALMDVVVVPSRFEGFGLTAAEAMALGKPVVGSDVDGLSELIDHGYCGLSAPRCDPAGLAGQISVALKDPGLARRLAAEGMRRVQGGFSRTKFVDCYLSLYGSVIGADTSSTRHPQRRTRWPAPRRSDNLAAFDRR